MRTALEAVILKYQRDVAILGHHVIDFGIAGHDRTGCHIFQPGDDAQQGGLSAARGANQHDKSAIGDLDINSMDDANAAKRFLDILDAYA